MLAVASEGPGNALGGHGRSCPWWVAGTRRTGECAGSPRPGRPRRCAGAGPLQATVNSRYMPSAKCEWPSSTLHTATHRPGVKVKLLLADAPESSSISPMSLPKGSFDSSTDPSALVGSEAALCALMKMTSCSCEPEFVALIVVRPAVTSP